MGYKYKDSKKEKRKEEQKETKASPKFEFPSNVRQIGGINKGTKIYIEDYAYTYINKLGAKTGKDEAAVFLVGFLAHELGEKIVVITGAIRPPLSEHPNDGQVFSSSDWKYAKNMIVKYFPGLEIVGWARLQPGYGLYLSAADISGHYLGFTEKHAVLFLCDPEEKLNCFFVWNEKQDDLDEAAGYFVYYDKNHEMNAYIAETRKTGFGEADELDGDEKAEGAEYFVGFEVSDKIEEDDGEEPVELEAGETMSEDEQERRSARLSKSVENAKRLADIQRQKRIISMMTSVSVLLFFACVIMGIGLLQSGERISIVETQLKELRNGYNNTVAKLNDSVFPAFAAQTERREPQAIEDSVEAALAQKENNEPNIEEDLGIVPVKETADETTAASAAEDPNAADSAEPVTYVVRQGDTLTYISLKFYGSSSGIEKIMDANGLSDPDRLVEGKLLVIP